MELTTAQKINITQKKISAGFIYNGYNIVCSDKSKNERK